ncbi:MAG: hypothetical protein IAE80_15235 [Anaerolinea sp.]|nr:hypothetical protein [Anaerolinea sp.]
MSRLLGGREIFIGDMLNSIPARIAPDRMLSPYTSGWASYRLLDTTLFGIRALVTNVRAPFPDREITQQIFDLALDDDYPPTQLEAQYRDRIERDLGSPAKLSRYTATMPSQVAFSETWHVGDLQVSLSIFGGARQSHNGEATAGLYVNLLDDTAFAAPYLAALMARESALWGTLTTPEIVLQVAASDTIRPYALGQQTPDERTRRLQKAFYKRELLETPKIISDRLSLKHVLLWRHGDHVFVSTKFDTVLITPQKTGVEVVRLLPAKGGGSIDVHIDELSLPDQFQSDTLLDLVETLRRLCPVKYQYAEYPDA